MRLPVVAAMMAVAAGFSLTPLTSLTSAPSRTVRLVSGHHRSYAPRGLAVRICGVVRNISQARGSLDRKYNADFDDGVMGFFPYRVMPIALNHSQQNRNGSKLVCNNIT